MHLRPWLSGDGSAFSSRCIYLPPGRVQIVDRLSYYICVYVMEVLYSLSGRQNPNLEQYGAQLGQSLLLEHAPRWSCPCDALPLGPL